MRVSVSLSLCTAIALTIGVSDASAQMNADEIFSRLKAQAGSTGTVQAAPGAQTRGLRANYGEPAEAATPAQTVVAVPSQPAAALAAVPSAPAAAPAYATVEPAATELTPTYSTSAAESALPSFAPSVEPASVSVTAPAAVPSVTVAAPTYQAAAPAYEAATPAPSYVLESPMLTEPVATPVAVRPSAASYSAVAEDKRVDLRIYFEWNSASLKPEAIGQLAELCSAIRRVGASEDNKFKIIGHTDKSGSNDYNLYLSNARAREVKRHLVEECALPAAALLAVGEGENQSSPSTPANAPEERRVEIQFVS